MRFPELPAWAAVRTYGECDTLQQLPAEATLEDYAKISGAQFWSRVEKSLDGLSGLDERNVDRRAVITGLGKAVALPSAGVPLFASLLTARIDAFVHKAVREVREALREAHEPLREAGSARIRGQQAMQLLGQHQAPRRCAERTASLCRGQHHSEHTIRKG